MAYALFSTDQTYNVGDVVLYEGVAYAFLYPHVPGEWNSAQVIAINPSFSYASPVQDFNTLPNYNLSSPLPPGKFRVNYFVDNDNIVIPGNFPNDNNAYLPGEVATIKGYPYTHFSEDGLWAYTFIGWSLAKGTSYTFEYYPGYQLTMPSIDVNLYAVWSQEATFTVDSAGVFMMNASYKTSLNKIIIPEYFGGSRVKIIGADAFKNSTILEIVIPPNITEVRSNAFDNWSGNTLRFIDAEVTTKYPYLKLNSGAFNNTPNLVNIILPYRWHAATNVPNPVFPAQFKSSVLHIYIRNSKSFMEDLLNPDPAGNPTFDVENFLSAPVTLNMHYDRVFHWGYND